MKWDLIIFDCDGVLVDSEAIGNRFIAEALTALGIETSTDEALGEFLGGKLTQIKISVEKKLDKKLPDDWVDKIYEKQFAEFKRSLKPIPGIENVLRALTKNDVLICVGDFFNYCKSCITVKDVTVLSKMFACWYTIVFFLVLSVVVNS